MKLIRLLLALLALALLALYGRVSAQDYDPGYGNYDADEDEYYYDYDYDYEPVVAVHDYAFIYYEPELIDFVAASFSPLPGLRLTFVYSDPVVYYPRVVRIPVRYRFRYYHPWSWSGVLISFGAPYYPWYRRDYYSGYCGGGHYNYYSYHHHHHYHGYPSDEYQNTPSHRPRDWDRRNPRPSGSIAGIERGWKRRSDEPLVARIPGQNDPRRSTDAAATVSRSARRPDYGTETGISRVARKRKSVAQAGRRNKETARKIRHKRYASRDIAHRDDGYINEHATSRRSGKRTVVRNPRNKRSAHSPRIERSMKRSRNSGMTGFGARAEQSKTGGLTSSPRKRSEKGYRYPGAKRAPKQRNVKRERAVRTSTKKSPKPASVQRNFRKSRPRAANIEKPQRKNKSASQRRYSQKRVIRSR